MTTDRRTFLKAGAEISTPLWVTLGIFSFNSFVALHSHNPVHVTTHETRIDGSTVCSPAELDPS